MSVGCCHHPVHSTPAVPGTLPLLPYWRTVTAKALAVLLMALTILPLGVGATEVMFALFQSFLNPGDEVVLLEPAFDIYSAQATFAGV